MSTVNHILEIYRYLKIFCDVTGPAGLNDPNCQDFGHDDQNIFTSSDWVRVGEYFVPQKRQ